MAKKNYKVRLYYPHDLDLISYMRHYQFDIIKAIYCSSVAFSKGEMFVFAEAKPREVPLEKKKIYSKTLRIDTEKDIELYEILSKMSSGYRNNFLKNILRLYLIQPISFEFFQDSEYENLIESHISVLKAKKKKVELFSNDKKARSRKQNKENNANDLKISTTDQKSHIKKGENQENELFTNNEITEEKLNDPNQKSEFENYKKETVKLKEENFVFDDSDLTQLFSDLIK